MAICPFAKQEIIRPGSNDPYINARLAILHVAVSMAFSIRSIFLGRSGIESHFYVNWRGKIIQYRDTNRQADANLGANDIAVSIETAGWGSGKWNTFQRRSIKRLLLWLHRVEGIPLKVPSDHRDSGVGYHVQFGAPGGWTTVAKSCPGPDRVKQYWRWLVPWMRSNPTAPKPEPKPAPVQEEDDMPSVDDLLDAALNPHDPKGRNETESVTVREALSAFVIEATRNGHPATQEYLNRARKSRAPK